MKELIALSVGVTTGALGGLMGMSWGESLALCIAVQTVVYVGLHMRRDPNAPQ